MSNVPTPGPWVVQIEAELGGPNVPVGPDDEPATDTQSAGPFTIRRNRRPSSVAVAHPLATGIQRLADATLMAAAPELAETLFGLLTSPDLTESDLDPRTRKLTAAAWTLLVRVAPHLEL